MFAVTEIWSRPDSWTSSDLPAIYRSFDGDEYTQLKNGAQIVASKVSTDVAPRNFLMETLEGRVLPS